MRGWLALIVTLLTSLPVAAQPLIDDGQFRSVLSCCQVLDTEGAYLQPHWWMGPGVGGRVTVSAIPYGTGQQILNLDWQVAPQFPGVDPMADGRETVLEYHADGQVLALDAARLRLTFWALSGRGSLTIVPLLWPMYRQGVYWLIPCAPVELPEGQWREVTCEVQLPSVGYRAVSSAQYVGIGVDLTPVTAPPHLLLGEFSLVHY